MIIPGQLLVFWPQVQYSDMPTGCALDKLQPGQDQKTGISIIPMYIKKGVFWKSYIFVCQQHTCKPKSYFIVSCRYHVYGLVVNTMHAMLAGAKSIILPKSVEKSRWEKHWKYSQRFEPDSFVSSLAKHQPHFFNLVPPLVSSILNIKHNI